MTTKVRRTALAAIFAAILLIRFIPHAGEVYARCIYPTISAVLSALSSVVPFSVDEWIVILAAAFIIAYPIYGYRQRLSARHVLGIDLEALLWIVAWFYTGWGMNYFRDSFFCRAGIPSQQILSDQNSELKKQTFRKFLYAYTDSLNASYIPRCEISHDSIRQEIKNIYMHVPENYGLCRPREYQHPKMLSFNFLYSSVGVLGFMGPFAGEHHLNAQLFPVQYPFTYAHELAHLLSVSNEAEANYWAYQICTSSRNRYIHYSGYYGILSNVARNARAILSKKEFEAWRSSIDSRIINERLQQQTFWRKQYSPLLAAVQDQMFNLLLKGNNIPDGTVNYDRVITMIIECPEIVTTEQ